jgi:outer membrane protein OmpA-like peptidoglycan-associated protein
MKVTTDLAQEMAAVRKDLLSAPVSEKQMLLDASTLESTDKGNALDMKLIDEMKTLGKGGADSGERVKGFSNLDDLLGQGGGQLGGSTAPILMPTDLLFEYGSADLAEGARLSLMKLGFLIQKNPNSLFIVEGHTDSFGSDDYNLQLSQARALAVVNWLRESLKLGTDRIQAQGKGESTLIAPSNGTAGSKSRCAPRSSHPTRTIVWLNPRNLPSSKPVKRPAWNLKPLHLLPRPRTLRRFQSASRFDG